MPYYFGASNNHVVIIYLLDVPIGGLPLCVCVQSAGNTNNLPSLALIRLFWYKNSQSNLVVLCKKHHDDVHQNKIRIHGWKETSNGIILDWDRCDNITKKKCKYTDTEIEIIKSFSNNTLSQKMKIMKLKNEHNIEISLSTFRKYM